MTYCLAIRTRSGIVGIADTRITSGRETTKARKLYLHHREKHSLFLMTAGLRSVRDKALTYFQEAIAERDESFNKLYKAVNAFGEQVKRVADEDKNSIEDAGYNFDLFALVGGQLEDDDDHKLFMLYPQGNWIEVGEGTPFSIIGNTGYGKPILDRTINFDSSLEFALKTGFLSFDATRLSSNDVEFPIDVIIYKKDSFNIVMQRYEKDELRFISKIWNDSLTEYINNIPDEWMQKVFDKLQERVTN